MMTQMRHENKTCLSASFFFLQTNLHPTIPVYWFWYVDLKAPQQIWNASESIWTLVKIPISKWLIYAIADVQFTRRTLCAVWVKPNNFIQTGTSLFRLHLFYGRDAYTTWSANQNSKSWRHASLICPVTFYSWENCSKWDIKAAN